MSRSPWCQARPARTAMAVGPVSWWTTGRCRRSSTRQARQHELPCVARGSAESGTGPRTRPTRSSPPRPRASTSRLSATTASGGRARCGASWWARASGASAERPSCTNPTTCSWRYVGPLLTGDASQIRASSTGPARCGSASTSSGSARTRRPAAPTCWSSPPGTRAPPTTPCTGPAAPGRHLRPTALHRLDYGGRYFYAPQSTRDEHGRRIMFGWLQEGADGRGERAGRLVRRDVPAEGRHARHGRRPASGPGAGAHRAAAGARRGGSGPAGRPVHPAARRARGPAGHRDDPASRSRSDRPARGPRDTGRRRTRRSWR